MVEGGAPVLRLTARNAVTGSICRKTYRLVGSILLCVSALSLAAGPLASDFFAAWGSQLFTILNSD